MVSKTQHTTCFKLFETSPSALGLENINEIVHSGIASDRDICRIDSVFVHDSFDFVVVDVRQGHRARYVQTALVLLLEGDVRGRFIDTNAKSFQLRFNNSLVSQWLIDIQYDKDQMACFSNRDDLATSTTTILSTLDNTGKVNNL